MNETIKVASRFLSSILVLLDYYARTIDQNHMHLHLLNNIQRNCISRIYHYKDKTITKFILDISRHETTDEPPTESERKNFRYLRLKCMKKVFLSCLDVKNDKDCKMWTFIDEGDLVSHQLSIKYEEVDLSKFQKVDVEIFLCDKEQDINENTKKCLQKNMIYEDDRILISFKGSKENNPILRIYISSANIVSHDVQISKETISDIKYSLDEQFNTIPRKSSDFDSTSTGNLSSKVEDDKILSVDDKNDRINNNIKKILHAEEAVHMDRSDFHKSKSEDFENCYRLSLYCLKKPENFSIQTDLVNNFNVTNISLFTMLNQELGLNFERKYPIGRNVNGFGYALLKSKQSFKISYEKVSIYETFRSYNILTTKGTIKKNRSCPLNAKCTNSVDLSVSYKSKENRFFYNFNGIRTDKNIRRVILSSKTSVKRFIEQNKNILSYIEENYYFEKEKQLKIKRNVRAYYLNNLIVNEISKRNEYISNLNHKDKISITLVIFLALGKIKNELEKKMLLKFFSCTRYAKLHKEVKQLEKTMINLPNKSNPLIETEMGFNRFLNRLITCRVKLVYLKKDEMFYFDLLMKLLKEDMIIAKLLEGLSDERKLKTYFCSYFCFSLIKTITIK